MKYLEYLSFEYSEDEEGMFCTGHCDVNGDCQNVKIINQCHQDGNTIKEIPEWWFDSQKKMYAYKMRVKKL